MNSKDIARKIKDTLYWDLYYTIGYSSMNGVGNGLAAQHDGNSFSDGFGEAYVNNFGLGMAINVAYPVALAKLQKTKHYRLYANLFNLAVGGAFLAWHYHMGTEHPLQAVLPSIGVGTLMTNRHVTETQDLESKLTDIQAGSPQSAE